MLLRICLVALLLAACSDGASPTTTNAPPTTAGGVESTPLDPSTTTSVPVTSTQPPPVTLPPDVPQQLRDFEIARILLDGAELLVAVADSGDRRRQGLMGVEMLGDLDGMLFVFERDTTGGFWMKDTLLPLDIAFFTTDGEFVDGFPMEPCTTASCPTYQPSSAYRYALEVPLGDMPDDVATLQVRPEPSP